MIWIWIAPNNTNKELLVEVLSDLGFDDEGIAIIRSRALSQHKNFIWAAIVNPIKQNL